MADDFSKVMKVVLEPHDVPVTLQSAVGPVQDKVSFNQWMVFVESDKIDNPSHRLHVGYIGKQAGANFCPLNELNTHFWGPQRDWIAEQAKALHGKASQKPFVNLPPPEK